MSNVIKMDKDYKKWIEEWGVDLDIVKSRLLAV